LIVDDQWQLLREVREREPNRIEAQAFVPEGSLWFSGHFPGEPILPGIALISTALEAIVREAGKRGEEIRLEALKRVRFTSPVRPGEKLSLVINRESGEEENLFAFKVTGKENVVCSGLIVVGYVKKAKKEEGNAYK
jgi:3-hydroxyacyl-[acyl-carrier-protein] dehydratase